MKITQINMGNSCSGNPFYSVKWTDATAKQKAEVYNVISRINDSRVSK